MKLTSRSPEQITTLQNYVPQITLQESLTYQLRTIKKVFSFETFGNGICPFSFLKSYTKNRNSWS